MKFKAPNCCPVCGHEMTISSLSCSYCQTRIEGSFTPCKFCKLPVEQREFIEVFLKCRGNIKDVEKELGISYPTVRNRLDGVIKSLGYKVQKHDGFATQKGYQPGILKKHFPDNTMGTRLSFQ